MFSTEETHLVRARAGDAGGLGSADVSGCTEKGSWGLEASAARRCTCIFALSGSGACVLPFQRFWLCLCRSEVRFCGRVCLRCTDKRAVWTLAPQKLELRSNS